MTKYGRSPWLDAFPKSRVPVYPRHRGDMQTEAVIVGGGLTGCTTAYAFAAAGLKVLLLEADQIGRGATANSSGWIADEPAVGFADLEKAVGLRGARYGWQVWRRAALDFISLLRRLDIKCHLEERGSALVAATPEQVAQLKRDQKARREAGVDVSMMNARAIKTDFGLDASAAIRSRHGATLDPYRACVGLAAAAADRGAVLFERSPVGKITFNRKIATVMTANGRIRTRRVVVATGMPTPLFKALARHFWFHTTYAVQTEPVPAKIRQQIGLGRAARASRSSGVSRSGQASRSNEVVRDSAQPPHIIRWIEDDRILITGADSEAIPPRLRDKVIVQRTGQLMYELSTLYPEISGIRPDYGWAADYARTAEGLPYLGPHRNYPHHLFAFGDSSRSMTGAYLASRILLRHHSGELDRGDDVFGFHR
jgi:glycine/D-amino acid oxidase-like deaminating enzyme